MYAETQNGVVNDYECVSGLRSAETQSMCGLTICLVALSTLSAPVVAELQVRLHEGRCRHRHESTR